MSINDNRTIIDGVTVNGTTTTADMDLNRVLGFFIDVSYTKSGTVSGEVKLQASADNINFRDVSGTVVALNNAAVPGDTQYNISNSFYRTVRLVCESTSGDITFTAVVVGKTPETR